MPVLSVYECSITPFQHISQTRESYGGKILGIFIELRIVSNIEAQLLRFIDDIWAIWIFEPGENQATSLPWKAFCEDLSFGRLTWKVTKPSRHAVFLDLNLYIVGRRIKTFTYQKEQVARWAIDWIRKWSRRENIERRLGPKGKMVSVRRER